MNRLKDALSRMKATAAAPFGDKLDRPIDCESELKELVDKVALLGAGASGGNRQSLATLALARERWGASKGSLEPLTARQIRALCADVHVAVSLRFVRALEANGELPKHRRWIESLIASYFSAWRPAEAAQLESTLRAAIEGFRGKSPRIVRCKPVAAELFSARAAKWLGGRVVEERTRLRSVLEEWGVEQAGALAENVANASVDAWLAKFASSRAKWTATLALAEVGFLLDTVLEPDIVSHEQLSKAISQVVLWREIDKNEALVEALRGFVLKHPRLGDPRRKQSNWSACDPEAYAKVRAWFARFDLEFFFRFVIQDDPHRRKVFWLDYIDKVEMSNVALCTADAQRMRVRVAERPAYSRVTGSSTVSAFLMRFPGTSAIFVEFSQPGNALYVHDAGRFEKFVRGDITKPSLHIREDLKNDNSVAQRVVHREGWQYEVRSILAKYGIRP